MLAVLLDPDPEGPLEPAAIRAGAKRCTEHLRCSSELTAQISDIWRLRSAFLQGHGCDSLAIRALREKHGVLAMHVLCAWGAAFGWNVAPHRERLDWFDSLPRQRVWPDFLPSGQTLIENGVKPGPDLGRLLVQVEDAALLGELDSEASALAWALDRHANG